MSGKRPAPDIEGMTSLKVDNLSYRTGPEELRRLFERYGEIGDIHIPRDRFSRQSKGFAFVRFVSRREAEDALERVDGRRIDGREIRVVMARYGRAIDEGGSDRDRDRGRKRYSRRSDSRSRSRSRSRTRSRSKSPSSRRRRTIPVESTRSHSHSKDRSRSKSKSADSNDRKKRSKSGSRSDDSRHKSSSPDDKK